MKFDKIIENQNEKPGFNHRNKVGKKTINLMKKYEKVNKFNEKYEKIRKINEKVCENTVNYKKVPSSPTAEGGLCGKLC